MSREKKGWPLVYPEYTIIGLPIRKTLQESAEDRNALLSPTGPEIVSLLIEFGADVNAKIKRGKYAGMSALQLAEKLHESTIADMTRDAD